MNMIDSLTLLFFSAIYLILSFISMSFHSMFLFLSFSCPLWLLQSLFSICFFQFQLHFCNGSALLCLLLSWALSDRISFSPFASTLTEDFPEREVLGKELSLFLELLTSHPRIKSNFLLLRGMRPPNHLEWDTLEQNLGSLLASPPGQHEGHSCGKPRDPPKLLWGRWSRKQNAKELLTPGLIFVFQHWSFFTS